MTLGTHRVLQPGIRRRWCAVLLICAGVATVGTFALIRATSPPANPPSSGPVGPGSDLTLTRPMGRGGKQVTLSVAASALGGPVVLPNSTQVTPSDVGAVWMGQLHGDTSGDTSTAVAVTFPSQGLIIQYARPASPDPLANYQSFVSQSPGSQVVYLGGGVPALAVAAPSDGSGWESVGFVSGGTSIIVLGHSGKASLQDVAQSILNRATATS